MPARDYNAYMRKYMNDRYHRRRAAAIQQLGGRCLDCGSGDDLEFDHPDCMTKVSPVGQLFASGSKTKLQAELERCVLRCNDCHREKTKRYKDTACRPATTKTCCGRSFASRFAYAGHRRWHSIQSGVA